MTAKLHEFEIWIPIVTKVHSSRQANVLGYTGVVGNDGYRDKFLNAMFNDVTSDRLALQASIIRILTIRKCT